jgi:uncharacterized RDD family membrane protein YckC
MADASWYAHINGKNIGPLSEADLKAKAAAGQVTATHLVWREGWPRWKPLATSGLLAPVLPFRSIENRDFAGQSTPTSGSQVSKTETSQPRDTHGPTAHDLGLDSFGGFWIRLLANATDNVILFIPNTIVGVIMNLSLGQAQGTMLSMLWNTMTTLLYFSVLQARMEGSLGKKIFGLTLVDQNLQPLSNTAASRRYVMLVLGTIPFGAGAIAAGLHARKQGWHDRYAGSFVVKRSALEAARACSAPIDRIASGHADQLGKQRAA